LSLQWVKKFRGWKLQTRRFSLRKVTRKKVERRDRLNGERHSYLILIQE
jgi:hypothetical protein